MNRIEQKALALLNEVLAERHDCLHEMLERDWSCWTGALCRSIERHEAAEQKLADFRQEVSDAVEMALKNYPPTFLREHLHQFIISAPEPDPLVDVLLEMDLSSDPEEGQHDAKWLRIKLDALGFEIREKNDG